MSLPTHGMACSACSVAQVDPDRILGRASHAVAGWHDVQGGADRPLQIHPLGNRGKAGELDELYDLELDPFEIENLNRSRKAQPVRNRLQRDLKRHVAEAIGL